MLHDMAIVLTRIDSRLIHGQILEGWLPYTEATMIIVADNKAASSPFRKKAMEMALPEDIKLKVENIEEAITDLKNNNLVEERVMVLFSSLHDVLAAVKRGVRAESINLGNVNYETGRIQVTPSVALSEEDIDDLRSLVEMGIRIDVRSVPREKSENIDKLIKHYFKFRRGE